MKEWTMSTLKKYSMNKNTRKILNKEREENVLKTKIACAKKKKEAKEKIQQ